jgi:hypothetical protein
MSCLGYELDVRVHWYASFGPPQIGQLVRYRADLRSYDKDEMTKPPPDDPVEYRRWVEDQPEEERERLLSHREVIAPAREVTYRIWADHDLRSAWRLLDPTLRTCIAQNWLHGNRQPVERADWIVEEVLGALIEDEPDHPLWSNFERVTLHQLSGWHDLSTWGIGLATCLHGPNIEAVAWCAWDSDNECERPSGWRGAARRVDVGGLGVGTVLVAVLVAVLNHPDDP